MSLKEYYDDYWTRDKPPPFGDPLAELSVRLLREELAQVSAQRVLEAGCGHGAALAFLAQSGMTVAGMDVSDRAIHHARELSPGSEFSVHSAEDLPWPFEQTSFDAVFAFEVIEHLLQPRRLLEGARDVLRQGGHIALTTPFHGRVKNMAIVLAAFERHFAVEGDHIRFFTDDAIRKLLDQTGFELRRIRHFGRFWPVWAGTFVWGRKR